MSLAQLAKDGSTSTSRGYRYWCLTLNNPSNDEMDQLLAIVVKKGWEGIIAKEIGDISNLAHLQGFIKSKNQIRLSTLKSINERIHWEPTKSNELNNVKYCSKDGCILWKNLELTLEQQVFDSEYGNGVIWKPFQKYIIEKLESIPDSRTIHWIYDKEGCCGKSYLAKWIAISPWNGIVGDGKQNDIFNQIKVFIDVNKTSPHVILFDIPRTQMEYLNYGMIEKIKGGLLYSGKFEGGKCVFKYPHIFVFSNSLPDLENWTIDRYVILSIKNKQGDYDIITGGALRALMPLRGVNSIKECF